MVKQILLDEMVLQENISDEKKVFLDECRKKINESVHISVETSPRFERSLSQGASQFQVVVESSKAYDAVVVAGPWCYIDSIATNKNVKERVHVSMADRQDFLFNYKGQEFLIRYGKIPKAPRK